MADDVQVKFGASVEGIQASMKQASDSVRQFAEQTKTAVAGLAAPLEQLQRAMLGIAAVAAGGAIFKSFVDSALSAAIAITTLE